MKRALSLIAALLAGTALAAQTWKVCMPGEIPAHGRPVALLACWQPLDLPDGLCWSRCFRWPVEAVCGDQCQADATCTDPAHPTICCYDVPLRAPGALVFAAEYHDGWISDTDHGPVVWPYTCPQDPMPEGP